MTTSPSSLSSSTIALVTGSNKGIGLEVARQLAQQGLTVLIGARDQQRGEAAATQLQAEGLRAQFLQLDVTDGASLTAAAADVKARYGKLDILVNNAGVQLDDQPPSQVSIQVLQDTFNMNVFGVVRVTQAMLPLLRAAEAARIVNMGSAMGSLTLTSDPDNMRSGYWLLAYAASKAALNAVTVQFANELRVEGIKVNAADPGYVATDLTGQQGFNSVEDGALPAVRLALLPADGPTASFFNIDGSMPW
ncbi:SDR family oxidoreductase (plasmid) [Deinococcus radiomollis]|uniref:SDR family oxidoreductase n=1 Tax=Deinococcus radiomollis TaxID=468916 RepID=UPI003892AF2C